MGLGAGKFNRKRMLAALNRTWSAIAPCLWAHVRVIMGVFGATHNVVCAFVRMQVVCTGRSTSHGMCLPLLHKFDTGRAIVRGCNAVHACRPATSLRLPMHSTWRACTACWTRSSGAGYTPAVQVCLATCNEHHHHEDEFTVYIIIYVLSFPHFWRPISFLAPLLGCTCPR